MNGVQHKGYPRARHEHERGQLEVDRYPAAALENGCVVLFAHLQEVVVAAVVGEEAEQREEGGVRGRVGGRGQLAGEAKKRNDEVVDDFDGYCPEVHVGLAQCHQIEPTYVWKLPSK